MHVFEQFLFAPSFQSSPFLSTSNKEKIYNDFLNLMQGIEEALFNSEPFYFELSPILLSEELFEHLTTRCGFPIHEGSEQIPPFIRFHSHYLDSISGLEEFFDFMEHELIFNSCTEDINREIRNIALLYRYINFECFFTEERERALQKVKEIMKKHRISINCIIC